MECLQCKKEFQPRQKFCCKNCKVKYWVANNRERFNRVMAEGKKRRRENKKLQTIKSIA